MSSKLRTGTGARLAGKCEFHRLRIWEVIVICHLAIAVFSTNALGYPAQITVTIAGTGTGSVNSNPSGIYCVTGSLVGCQTNFNVGQAITLFATPGSRSTFTGWSGYGCADRMNSTCSILLGDFVPNNPIATFNIKPLKVGTAYYATIQDAFDLATDGAAIEGIVDVFTEDVVINRDIIITFKGGKSDDFNNTIGNTTIQGSLSISKGTLILMDLVIS